MNAKNVRKVRGVVMEAETLRKLRESRGLTLEALAEEDPELAKRVRTLIRREEARRIIEALAISEKAREAVAEIDFSDEREDLVELLRAKLVKLDFEEDEVERIVRHATRIKGAPPSGQPIGAHPAVAIQVDHAHIADIATLAGLSGAVAKTLADAANAAGLLNDAALTKLVTDQKLTDAQAQAVGFSAAVHSLADQDMTLATALRSAPIPRLGGKPASSTADLAALSPSDWTSYLTASNVTLPAGATPESAGLALASRFALLHPTDAFFARLPQFDAAQLTQHLHAVAPAFARNRQVAGTSFSALDTTGLAEGQIASLVPAHLQLVQFVNAYPGLQLAAVLDDPHLTPEGKAQTIRRRVGLVQQLRTSGIDFLHLDLTTGSADVAKLGLARAGATEQEQSMVLATLQAYQRVSVITRRVEDAHALLQGGFTSALSIARHNLERFQAQAGLDATTISAIWGDARGALADVTMTAGSMVDIFGGLFNKLHVGNQPPTVEEYLKKLAGFQDMFGNLSFCDCQECASILGPAAYFVDLMKFIDENLRTQFSGHPNHPLDLKRRRPDLWTIELSCDNTNTLVPLLDIVNAVLENYIAISLGDAGPLTDRAAIGTLVYRNELQSLHDSFHQPFHLPLARIASYLAKLGGNRTDIAVAIGADLTVRAQAELALSPLELQLITTADPDLTHLSHIYGVAFSGPPNAVDAVDAQLLAAGMGLSRDDLGMLIATRFVAAGGAGVSIVASKRDASSVQNDAELVTGLTADALDRMHRLTRLARKSGWAIPDLDLILSTLGDTALAAAGLQAVAQLHAMQARFGISVAELCALVGALPTVPAGKSLFDRRFNPPSYVAADGALPKPTTHFVHPAFRQKTPAPVDPALPRLLTGLSVDLDGLAALARHLAPHLAQEGSPSFDPNAANDDDRYFVLSAPNLTLLYRHARLARLLRVSIDQLFALLGLIGLDRVSGLSSLQSLLDLEAWWRPSGYRLDDIAVANGRTPLDASRYPDPATVAARVAAAAGAGLTFTDTVFAVVIGTTERGSRDIIASNPAVIEATTAGKWRLVSGIDLDTAAISLPPTATVPTPPSGTRAVTDAEVRQALRPYLAAEVLVRSIGSVLNFATDKVVALAALVGQPLTSDGLVRAVRGDGPLPPLTALVAALQPVAIAFGASVWDAPAINFVRTNTLLFGADALPHTVPDVQHPNAPFLSLSQLQALSTYARIAQRQLGAAPDGPPASPDDIRAVLLAFDATIPGFPATSDPPMARVLNVPSGLVVGLRGRVNLPTVAVPALDRLDRAAQLAATLGVDGETFGALPSNDYDLLSHAADALSAVLGARFTDETARAAKLDEAEQPVREAKRDALADYLLHSVTPKIWATLSDLYEYFLIDVDAGGCEQTSLVVSATMSAQLYVYRAIMNLEQDDLPATDPNHIALQVPADAATEWEWRKNFRVWQANREVFLWPQDYLLENLRDDKTPQFKELEQNLLQTDISDQNVLDAYTKYLSGFEEVSSLTIAGAYHEVRYNFRQYFMRGPQTPVIDVLHVFGATAADPPTYYYRTCENLIASGRDPNVAATWTPWEKITVQITGRKVSPIVYRGRLHVFWTDYKTRPMNQVQSGASQFAGYSHTMSLKFTTLRADRTWTAPQKVHLPGSSTFGSRLGPATGQILESLSGGNSGTASLDPQKRYQTDPIDDYTLSGPNWDWVWPFIRVFQNDAYLEMVMRDFEVWRRVDLFAHETPSIQNPSWPSSSPQLLCAKIGSDPMPLFYGTPTWLPVPNPAHANLLIDETRIDAYTLDAGSVKVPLTTGLYVEQIAKIPASTLLLAVPGSVEDGLLQVGNDVLLLQASLNDYGGYTLRRLGTTLVEEIARRLFEDGVDAVLDIKTQVALAEAGIPITLVGNRIVDRSNTGKLDFKGPYGGYYRELFFHIPLLIAEALNSRGRFAAAQRWYHYIFDPTATEVIDVTGVPPNEVAHRLLDRVWRYREFRGLDLVRLRAILTDKDAIAQYKKDPFNPWAIARRRISALQEAVVMKYVGNLLDWADSLFTQFTMESVNEALMLYIMASDILGPRPVKLGDCGTGASPMTYEKIGPLVDGSSEILIELESWIIGARVSPDGFAHVVPWKYAAPYTTVYHAVGRYPLASPAQAAAAGDGVSSAAAGLVANAPALGIARTPAVAEGAVAAGGLAAATAAPDGSPFRGFGWNATRTTSWGPALGNASVGSADKSGGRSLGHAWKGDFASWLGRFGWGIVRQLTPVFCVPANADLLALWDRVEDRLYKIRHCMDISGQKRELALFAPPISPMQLVAMKAAGLSLDDVLGAINGSLPPYRFLYLIDRAKAFAASLSGFGASLLSALEKKDGEELNRLRLTQGMNMAQLTTHVRELDIQVASQSLEALNRQRDAAQYRSEYYAGLLSQDRNTYESIESITRYVTSTIHYLEAGLDLSAAIETLIPEVGSPFAMKYGGVALGGSAERFGNEISAIAEGADAIASAVSLEGNFARRREGWGHQKTLAAHDVKSLDRQIAGMSIRLDIANNALDLHQKSLDQIQEMLDLTDGKFTNLGLYTWLSTQLQRFYRGAYQNALALAKLAEQAYRFERGDDTSPGLAMSYWDSTHSGLLSGEQLLADLQTLERRYLETNYRCLEIDQPFALSQIDAQALVDLRETGECRFTVSEPYLNLFYPGIYKARIKAVRLTIPCVTGPYVNVSATLSLDKSWMRPTVTPGLPLVEMPPSRSVSIATSTAQNDAGIFELSFRDERYMPFEGLGAISQWHLVLPKAFRQFDYLTVNDAILSISYTAELDGVLRDRVESQNAALEGSIVNYFSNNPARRVLSLRQDFSNAFTRLLRSPASTQISIELTDRNFPLFVQGRDLQVQRGVILLRTASGAVPMGVQLTIDGTAVSAFASDPTLGNLPTAALPGAFTANLRASHTFVIKAAGDLAPAAPPPGDTSVVDSSKLLDVLLYLEYQLA